MERESDGWAQKELEGMNLGDARRNERAKTRLTRLAEKPTASIPHACHGWSETMGAYRFMENPAFGWRDILQPHWQRTQERMREHAVVLCIQDTTELDFNGQEIKGLGQLNYEARRGLYLHPTYAVSADRVGLGVLDAWMWAREPKDADGERGGIKESARWIEGYERVAELGAALPGTRLVYVADREADFTALMQRADALGTPADWLIRSMHNRSLDGGEKLWPKVLKTEAVGEIQFAMAARAGQRARTVKQALYMKLVTLRCGLAVTCVIAKEIDPPAGVKPVEWRLLTNRVPAGRDELVELIDWYRARWEIEMFFNVLKNGCQVEALQLASVDRIERALALFMIVAWRIAHLMRMGRTCSELDAALFFDPDEIHGAYLLMNKRKPKGVPTLNEVLRLVAQLGGFLARKGDGELGAKTILEGLQQVMTAAQTLRALRRQAD
ncbi:IS4 family transposase (plasmid) [Ralstonia solanacearum]|uniref:IS4 family transposase n=2 Tax=Ralstonia solanacearum TaxID=305 RepID=UPI003CC698B4